MTNVASSGAGASNRSDSMPSGLTGWLVLGRWCLCCPLALRPSTAETYSPSSCAASCNASPISSLARCCRRSARDNEPDPNNSDIVGQNDEESPRLDPKASAFHLRHCRDRAPCPCTCGIGERNSGCKRS